MGMAELFGSFPVGGTAPHVPPYAGTRAGTWDGVSGYNLTPANTERLRRAIGRVVAGSGGGDIVFIGDSCTSGQYSAGVYTIASAWPFFMRQENVAVPAANQCDGMVRIVYQGFLDPRWGTVGNWTPGTTWAFSGTNGDTATFTATDTTRGSVAIQYWDFNDGSQWSYSINGAAAVTITNNSGTAGWKRLIVNVANIATVKLTHVAGAFVAFAGVTLYSANTSLVFHNISQPGATATGTGAASWTDAANPANNQSAWNVYVAPGLVPVQSANPDAVFIALGVNDLAGGASVTATLNAIQTLINKYAANSSVFLVVTQAFSNVADALWLQFAAGLYNLADSNGIGLIDFRYMCGTYAQETANGYATDGSGHFTPFANALIGRAAARAAILP